MLLLTLSTAMAGPCEGHALFTEGASMTMTYFNRKDKVTNTVVTENREVRDDGTAVLHGVSKDKKGEPIVTVDYEVMCGADGAMSIDMRAFVPPSSLEAYGSYDVQFDSTYLVYPSALSAGQGLEDAKLTADMTLAGAPGALGKVKFEIVIHDRKVVGQESVTTPAGTFDAWKITSVQDLSTRAMVNVSFQIDAVEWFVPGVGVVRSESTRKNGKDAGHAEMTDLNRG